MGHLIQNKQKGFGWSFFVFQKLFYLFYCTRTLICFKIGKKIFRRIWMQRFPQFLLKIPLKRFVKQLGHHLQNKKKIFFSKFSKIQSKINIVVHRNHNYNLKWNKNPEKRFFIGQFWNLLFLLLFRQVLFFNSNIFYICGEDFSTFVTKENAIKIWFVILRHKYCVNTNFFEFFLHFKFYGILWETDKPLKNFFKFNIL